MITIIQHIDKLGEADEEDADANNNQANIVNNKYCK